MDSWEEGFDTWTPRTPSQAGPGDDTGTDLDRAELLRLARELAERRHTPQTGLDPEIEQLKQSLRERAAAVAARERELTELQRRLERDRPGVRGRFDPRAKRSDAVDEETLAARERATHERMQALEQRERAVEAQTAELLAEAERLAEREGQLTEELQAVETKLAETEAERGLAAAERERLEERDRTVHEREKTLAAARLEIEAERQKLEARAIAIGVQAAALGSTAAQSEEQPAAAALAAVEKRERELSRRAENLDESERDLARVRQELDAERKALLERERRFRHREVADVRESFAQPFAPPSFSEGLAALARSRSRG